MLDPNCIWQKQWRRGLMLLLLLSWSGPAWAEEETTNQDAAALGGLGATGGEHGIGVELDLTLKYRISLFEIGAEARTAGWFPEVTMTSMGAIAGVAFGDPWSVHLWGAGGAHLYSGVGSTFGPPLSVPDPGVSAVLPYLGGRALFGYTTGEQRNQVRFFAGLMGLVDRDLVTVTRSSTYEFSGQEWVEPHEVGQWMGGVFLVAGVTFGL